ncbi:hypothetical protein HNR39_000848 [Glaciimonas immobilis]|uniref:Uncharacterized protein n=1 Tax=Glaciimonas immobilis TaxID=728004 RepID=A0A840RPY6_9BURK|nr:hypothetical protein [Glaciimonas immobilis]
MVRYLIALLSAAGLPFAPLHKHMNIVTHRKSQNDTSREQYEALICNTLLA